MPPPPPAPSRIRRLGSLKRTTPTPRTKAAQRPAARTQACCESPKIEDDGEGHSVCRNCFTLVSESNIVADVTFQEDSRGAATVQGGFVGENARHARTLGSAAFRRVGAGEKNNAQEIEASGRRALGSLCPKLGVPEATASQALQIYSFAAGHNFSAGRRTDEVIAACLYAACRRQKDNAILLIDIAEFQRLNVFRLGEVYKCLVQELYLDDGGVGTQYLIEVESLVMKYCRRLEFGDLTRQVAEDAVKIIKRMKRDWMVTGRHPAGLCGAAIILAARMNNFRRSVREIVYVSKVADMTVAKRVEEFRRTKSAALTVEQFREYGVLLKHQHDPPVLYESELKKQQLAEKKRKRQETNEARETAELSEAGSVPPSHESSAVDLTTSATPEEDSDLEDQPQGKRHRGDTEPSESAAPHQQEHRRDADGFLIPALPLDAAPTADAQQPEKRKRGRPKKQAPVPIVVTDEELITEAELEEDINDVLNDDEIEDSRNELEKTKDEERARMLAEEQKKSEADKNRERREAEGITWWKERNPEPQAESADVDLAAEFADDPEIANCILSPAEQQVKEQIWLSENADWLRSHHEREMLKAVGNASGRNEKGKRKNKSTKRKRKGRMGDGTTLAEATTPIETPADANMAMLEKRAPPTFSKYIDYDALRRVYEPSASSVSGSRSRAGSQTPSVSGTSAERTPSASGGVDSQSRASGSASPAARNTTLRWQTPPVTQGASRGTASAPTASRRAPAAPPSPPQTQGQAASIGAAEEEEESEGDADDYEQGYDGSEAGTPRDLAWDGDDDDREDIGEDDYERALDPTYHTAGAFDENDYV